ncbi:MAG: hypothetical protein RL367_2106 [Pseudomonadota bacterium]
MMGRWLKLLCTVGIRIGLAFGVTQMSGSAEKLSRPIPPHRLVVIKRAIPLAIVPQLIAPDSQLTLTGAWQLTSSDPKFGGLSSMMLAQGEFLFLSDAGALIRLRGPLDAVSTPATMVPLPGKCGSSWSAQDHDSESLALTPDGKGLRIGLETINAVCAVDLTHPGLGSVHRVAAMQGWRANYGPEAMASIAGKGLAIFGEGSVDKQGASPMLWYQGDPADPATPMIRMQYQPPQWHRPTDALFLPDGRMLVINRKFDLPFKFSALLTLVPAFAPREGQTVTGKVIARMDDPAIADNFEAIAASSDPAGTTIWIASDDNYFRLQRNLLLRFRLAKP